MWTLSTSARSGVTQHPFCLPASTSCRMRHSVWWRVGSLASGALNDRGTGGASTGPRAERGTPCMMTSGPSEVCRVRESAVEPSFLASGGELASLLRPQAAVRAVHKDSYTYVQSTDIRTPCLPVRDRSAHRSV